MPCPQRTEAVANHLSPHHSLALIVSFQPSPCVQLISSTCAYFSSVHRAGPKFGSFKASGPAGLLQTRGTAHQAFFWRRQVCLFGFARSKNSLVLMTSQCGIIAMGYRAGSRMTHWAGAAPSDNCKGQDRECTLKSLNQENTRLRNTIYSPFGVKAEEASAYFCMRKLRCDILRLTASIAPASRHFNA